MATISGKKVLVTGAGRGIGRQLVIKLANCGAEVVAFSNIEKELNSLKEVSNIRTVTVDITVSEQVRDLVRQHGPFHGLVNNAGIVELEPFLQVTEDSFNRQFNVNVKAPIVIGQEVAKGMIENKIKGSIVNVSSQASKMGLKDHTVYCGSKAALDGLSRVMTLELGQYGIRTNCVNPTVVMTEMGRLCWSDPAKGKPMLDRIPLGRFAEVEDVVNAIIFLLSDEAAMINGVTLPVDGGALAV